MKIAVLDDYQEVALQLADWGRLKSEVVVFNEPLTNVVEQLADFEIIVAMRERTKFDAETIFGLPKLKLIVTTGARNAAIDLAAAEERGITVSGTRSVEGATVELTWGLILSAARRLDVEFSNFRSGKWQTTVGLGLQGKTLGLLGIGRQGSGVAQVARAFGMEVLAFSRNLNDASAEGFGVKAVNFNDLLAKSDFLSIHIPLNPETEGMISRHELAQMKQTAWLINTSRGPIVEEVALVEALWAGIIAGYATDVYADEPLPAAHPFRSMENIVGTPHLGYVTLEMYTRWYEDAVDDIECFFKGKPQRLVN